MSNLLRRIIVSLVISCMLVDPGIAASLRTRPLSSGSQAALRTSVFTPQAIVQDEIAAFRGLNPSSHVLGWKLARTTGMANDGGRRAKGKQPSPPVTLKRGKDWKKSFLAAFLNVLESYLRRNAPEHRVDVDKNIAQIRSGDDSHQSLSNLLWHLRIYYGLLTPDLAPELWIVIEMPFLHYRLAKHLEEHPQEDDIAADGHRFIARARKYIKRQKPGQEFDPLIVEPLLMDGLQFSEQLRGADSGPLKELGGLALTIVARTLLSEVSDASHSQKPEWLNHFLWHPYSPYNRLEDRGQPDSARARSAFLHYLFNIVVYYHLHHSGAIPQLRVTSLDVADWFLSVGGVPGIEAIFNRQSDGTFTADVEDGISLQIAEQPHRVIQFSVHLNGLSPHRLWIELNDYQCPLLLKSIATVLFPKRATSPSGGKKGELLTIFLAVAMALGAAVPAQAQSPAVDHPQMPGVLLPAPLLAQQPASSLAVSPPKEHKKAKIIKRAAVIGAEVAAGIALNYFAEVRPRQEPHPGPVDRPDPEKEAPLQPLFYSEVLNGIIQSVLAARRYHLPWLDNMLWGSGSGLCTFASTLAAEKTLDSPAGLWPANALEATCISIRKNLALGKGPLSQWSMSILPAVLHFGRGDKDAGPFSVSIDPAATVMILSNLRHRFLWGESLRLGTSVFEAPAKADGTTSGSTVAGVMTLYGGVDRELESHEIVHKKQYLASSSIGAPSDQRLRATHPIFKRLDTSKIWDWPFLLELKLPKNKRPFEASAYMWENAYRPTLNSDPLLHGWPLFGNQVSAYTLSAFAGELTTKLTTKLLPEPQRPTGVTIQSTGPGSVDINWSAPAPARYGNQQVADDFYVVTVTGPGGVSRTLYTAQAMHLALSSLVPGDYQVKVVRRIRYERNGQDTVGASRPVAFTVPKPPVPAGSLMGPFLSDPGQPRFGPKTMGADRIMGPLFSPNEHPTGVPRDSQDPTEPSQNIWHGDPSGRRQRILDWLDSLKPRFGDSYPIGYIGTHYITLGIERAVEAIAAQRDLSRIQRYADLNTSDLITHSHAVAWAIVEVVGLLAQAEGDVFRVRDQTGRYSLEYQSGKQNEVKARILEAAKEISKSPRLVRIAGTPYGGLHSGELGKANAVREGILLAVAQIARTDDLRAIRVPTDWFGFSSSHINLKNSLVGAILLALRAIQQKPRSGPGVTGGNAPPAAGGGRNADLGRTEEKSLNRFHVNPHPSTGGPREKRDWDTLRSRSVSGTGVDGIVPAGIRQHHLELAEGVPSPETLGHIKHHRNSDADKARRKLEKPDQFRLGTILSAFLVALDKYLVTTQPAEGRRLLLLSSRVRLAPAPLEYPLHKLLWNLTYFADALVPQLKGVTMNRLRMATYLKPLMAMSEDAALRDQWSDSEKRYLSLLAQVVRFGLDGASYTLLRAAVQALGNTETEKFTWHYRFRGLVLFSLAYQFLEAMPEGRDNRAFIQFLQEPLKPKNKDAKEGTTDEAHILPEALSQLRNQFGELIHFQSTFNSSIPRWALERLDEADFSDLIGGAAGIRELFESEPEGSYAAPLTGEKTLRIIRESASVVLFKISSAKGWPKLYRVSFSDRYQSVFLGKIIHALFQIEMPKPHAKPVRRSQREAA